MDKVNTFLRSTWKKLLKVGQDDPRRVIHAIKVGVSLTIVSLLYLLEPLIHANAIYKEIGENVIWAVMTVVLVLEFTVGATLYKGMNRAFGTITAGSLAFFMEFIATENGRVLRAVIIGGAVFVVGAVATYIRFVPYIKKNYDYGVVIFMLTYNLIAVSSYRVAGVLKIAQERLYTIAIGVALCLVMSLLVLPNWSGEDLHMSIISRLEGLAESIEACVAGYFVDEVPDIDEDISEDPVYQGYKAALDSKSSDENSAVHASWEPRHPKHFYRFPGKQYMKLGGVLRHFGYTLVALHGCIQTEIQTPRYIRSLFKDPCVRLAGEVSNALMELANSIKNRRQCSPKILSDQLNIALQDLNTALKSQPRLFIGKMSNLQASNMEFHSARAASLNSEKQLSGVSTDSPSLLSEWRLSKRASKRLMDSQRKELRPTFSKLTQTSLEFSEALPFAAFASLLVEIVARLEMVIEQVEELGRIAKFREFNTADEVILTVRRPEMDDPTIHPE